MDVFTQHAKRHTTYMLSTQSLIFSSTVFWAQAWFPGCFSAIKSNLDMLVNLKCLLQSQMNILIIYDIKLFSFFRKRLIHESFTFPQNSILGQENGLM